MPNIYGDKQYAELINSVLKQIVYTSIADFERVFFEFDKIIAGEPSETLQDLTSLFNNEDLYINPNDPQQIQQFQKQIQDRLKVEKQEYATDKQRAIRLQEQQEEANARTLNQSIPKRDFPTKTDLILMEKYGITKTIAKPEFELCVKICEAKAQILKQSSDSLYDHEIEESVNYIYRILKMVHEANSIDRDFKEELLKLNNIKFLLQEKGFVIRQFCEDLDADCKSYILNNVEIFEGISTQLANPDILNMYIHVRSLLHKITPNLPTKAKLLFIPKEAYVTDIVLEPYIRQTIIELFANICNISFTTDTSDGMIYIALMRLACLLTQISIPYDIDLNVLYAIDCETLDFACKNIDSLSIISQVTETSIYKILQLSTNAICRLCNVYAEESNAILSVKDLLELSVQEIEFILSNKIYLPRIKTLVNYYGMSKESFAQAELKAKKTCLMNPAAIAHPMLAPISFDEIDFEAESPFFYIMASPEKDYEEIAEFYSYLELTLCTSTNISAYSYALCLKDTRLIQIINDNILERTHGYLNAFLMSNGFKKISTKHSTLPWQQTIGNSVNVANLDARNDKGDTALLVAIQQDNTLAALALLARGVNVEILGADQMTPLELARQKGNLHIFNDIFYTSKFQETQRKPSTILSL